MDHQDDPGAMVENVLLTFAYYRYVDGLGIDEAIDVVRNDVEIGQIVETMMAQTATVGYILGVEMGDQFVCRAEPFLIGLHDDLVRGISLGVTPNGVEVATCVVAVFVLHNTFLDDDLVIIGGEGGNLRDASRLHLRVLSHQRWTRRNCAMLRSMITRSRVRLLVRSLMADHTYRYNYLGLFRVRDYRMVMRNGYRVYEFLFDGV